MKGALLLPLSSLLYYNSTSKDMHAGILAQNQEPSGVANILILVFDTLSARHMSLYGYERKTTPNLERFASRATIYHTHYAGGNFTTPGTASLLTGSYPWTHRAVNYASTVIDRYKDRNLFSAFADGPYTKIAYTHNWVANFLLHQFRNDIDLYLDPNEFFLANGGFAEQLFHNDMAIAHRSFEHLILHGGGVPDQAREIPGSLLLSLLDRERVVARHREIDQSYRKEYPRGVPWLYKTLYLLEDAIDGIQEITNRVSQPFLAYFHLFPPHEPYSPRQEFVDLFNDGWQPTEKQPRFFSQGHSVETLNRKRQEYDQYLAYADAELGRLLDYLEQSGRLNDTLVVFTSDHGQLFERGIHGHVTSALYDPVIRVPLFILRPGQQQREDIHTRTHAVDLLPTLLHFAGQPIPDWCEGEVLPGFRDANTERQRPLFAVEAKQSSKYAPFSHMTAAMIHEQYKLIHYRGYNLSSEYELYNVINDPEEMEDLYPSQTSIAQKLRAELEDQIRKADKGVDT